MAKKQVSEKVGTVKGLLAEFPIEKRLRALLDDGENMGFSINISGAETTLSMTSSSTNGGERENYTHTIPYVAPVVEPVPSQEPTPPTDTPAQ